MSGRRVLDRRQALAWNPDWSDRDREMITAALDQVQSGMREGDYPTLYLPPSEAYIGAEVYGTYITAASDVVWAVPRDGYYRAVTVHKGLIEWIGTAAENMGELSQHALFRGRIIEDEVDTFGWMKIRDWVPLSTYTGRHPHAARDPEKVTGMCPACHTMLPMTGVCDYC